MSATEQDLEQLYDGLSDEELLSRLETGVLTDVARRVARAELAKRGLEAKEPPPEETDPEAPAVALNWQTILRTFNVVEAQVLRGRLEADGCPAIVTDYHQIQTNNLLAPAMGGARIQVPAEHAERATELLTRVQSGELSIPDDAAPQADLSPPGPAGKPLLWNPDMAAGLSWFFFTAVFGAAVHAVNWHRLGNNAKTRQSVVWAVGALAALLVVAALSHARWRSSWAPVWLANIVLLLLWYFILGRQQSKYLVGVLKRNYKKESWLVPVCLALIAVGTLLVSGMLNLR